MDPDELEALVTSVLGPQPETDKYGNVRWFWKGQLHREDGPAIEWSDGSKEWWRNGQRHREDGPAREPADGSKAWWRNGLQHREDGPAVEWADGSKWWCRNGQLHREDGPAVEWARGDKEWWRNGRRHRDDGPAVEYANGDKEWWRDGIQVEPFTESMDPDELEALATSVMGPQPVTDKFGTVSWFWRGEIHREDGPAIEWANGDKEWCRNGQRHREDGPAVEYADGGKAWFRDGQLHREDGPAVEHVDGHKVWYRNGQRHRDDGPAVEYANGDKEWWRNGVPVEPFTESMDPDELEAIATSVLGPQPVTDKKGTVRWYWRGQLHREDGPAIERANGTKGWWRNGKRHRDDGPAWEWADGSKMWWRNGELHRDDGPAIEWADGSKEWWRDGIQVEPFTESMDPDELEALATSVLGPQPVTDEEGTVRWFWRGQLHRDDGPAVEYVNGDKSWWRNGLQHREDGPAVEWANGSKWWCRNGELHREDGPAIERANGTKEWWRNGQLHRDDGPAIEGVGGSKMWCRNGVKVEPFTESMDPDEIEALATSVMGPQPVTDKEGTVRWYWRGQLHRDDGPAVEYVNGTKAWWRNGQRHREDGPAFEGANGDKEWWRNGLLHRDDGPACEWADGAKAWFRNGVEVEPFTENAFVLVANLLFENRVQAVKKKYSGIPEKVWDVFTRLDPSGGRQKYIDWIARSWIQSAQEDRPTPENLMAWVKELHQRKVDINAFATLADLERKATGEAMGGKRAQLMRGAHIFLDNVDWLIVSPFKHASSKFYGGSTEWCVSTSNVSYWYDYASKGALVFIKNRHLEFHDPLWKVAIYWEDGQSSDDIYEWGWYDKYDHSLSTEETKDIWNSLPGTTQVAIMEFFEMATPLDHVDQLEDEIVGNDWEGQGRERTLRNIQAVVRTRMAAGNSVSSGTLLRQINEITGGDPDSFLGAIHVAGFYSGEGDFNPEGGGTIDYESLKTHFSNQDGTDSEVMSTLDQLMEMNSARSKMFDVIEASLSYWQFKDLLNYWGEENLKNRFNDAIDNAHWKQSNKLNKPDNDAQLIVYNYEQVLDILRSTDPVLHQYLLNLSTQQESDSSSCVSTLLE